MPASCGKWPPTTSSAPSPAVATKTRSPVGSSKSGPGGAAAPGAGPAGSDPGPRRWAGGGFLGLGIGQVCPARAGRATFSGALEHDHRDLPVGLLLVLV